MITIIDYTEKKHAHRKKNKNNEYDLFMITRQAHCIHLIIITSILNILKKRRKRKDYTAAIVKVHIYLTIDDTIKDVS